MKTPLVRGLFIFAALAIIATIAYVFAPIKPNARFDITRPDRSPAEAEQWLHVVLDNYITVESADFGQQLQDLERFFYADGYRDFIILMQQSGAIHSLQNNDVIFDVEVIEYPNAIARGTSENIYSWLADTQLEFSVEFSPESIVRTPIDLRIVLSRSVEENTFGGLKIRQIVLRNQDENVSN
ncbi:MAG: DotI/IcmL/TraM family protein [Pseudomonadota bacterium]